LVEWRDTSSNTTTEVFVNLSAFNQAQKDYKRELLTDIQLRFRASIDSLEKNDEYYRRILNGNTIDVIKLRYKQAAKDIDSILNMRPLPDTLNFAIKGMPFLTEALNNVLKDTVSEGTTKK